jgi:hypothetical protein
MSHSPPRAVLKSLVGRLAFQVDGTDSGWEDVVLAARLWGDWAALETEVCEGIACIRHMLASGERPTAEEEETAAAAFRQARKLYSAAETEAWLTERGLTVENWFKYVRRTLLREKWAGQLADLAVRYPARADQVQRALKIVGICSGHFGRFAAKLAGRAAAFARLTQEGWQATPAPAPPGDPQAAKMLGLPADICQVKLRQLAVIELAYRVFAQRTCTPEAIQKLVVARHTDWIRIAYRSLVLKDEATAREAILCIRDDGEPFDQVAQRARVPLGEEARYLEEVDPAMRSYFLSAKKEELLGPFSISGGVFLCQVVDKTLPATDEPAIRQRAERVLLDAATQREVSARARWGKPLV